MSPSVFGHGHLRLYLLRLLADRPMHGYEIIQALTDQSGGTYYCNFHFTLLSFQLKGIY